MFRTSDPLQMKETQINAQSIMNNAQQKCPSSDAQINTQTHTLHTGLQFKRSRLALGNSPHVACESTKISCFLGAFVKHGLDQINSVMLQPLQYDKQIWHNYGRVNTWFSSVGKGLQCNWIHNLSISLAASIYIALYSCWS